MLIRHVRPMWVSLTGEALVLQGCSYTGRQPGVYFVCCHRGELVPLCSTLCKSIAAGSTSDDF